MDWRVWHDKYDSPDSRMARRLRTVQDQIRAILNSSRSGSIRVISLCAGQGRDLLEVLCDHPRRSDVRARLVELDENNTALAAEFARANMLDQIEIVTGDASLTDQYQGMVPADLVLICGLFGNIADADITCTIDTRSAVMRDRRTCDLDTPSSHARPRAIDLRTVRSAGFRPALDVW